MVRPVLIFPAGMPRSLAYLETRSGDGQRVIGSSLLGHDPARVRYPEWAHLPYITADDFDEALRRVISEFDIGGIFTPNPVVWDYLNRCIAQAFPGVALVNTSPVVSEVAPYHKALQFGATVLADPLPVATDGPVKSSLSALEIASLFRHAESIPGMCDHEKIRALCELFRHAPTGDVVEIGSWWGKSAFVLARLATCYGVGNLLCVDPGRTSTCSRRTRKVCSPRAGQRDGSSDRVSTQPVALRPRGSKLPAATFGGGGGGNTVAAGW